MLHPLVDVLIFLRVAVAIIKSLYVVLGRGTLVRDASSMRPIFYVKHRLRDKSSKNFHLGTHCYGIPKMEANVPFFFWLAVSTVCTYCAAVLNVILMLLGTAPAFLDTVCSTF